MAEASIEVAMILVGRRRRTIAPLTRLMSTVAQALKDAERYVGSSPRILATPECYSGGMAVNLIAAGAS